MQSGAANTGDAKAKPVSMGHDFNGSVMRWAYTKPTQNMDMIWSFFLEDICSLASVGRGRHRIIKSRAISMPPRMKLNRFILMTLEAIIWPFQPSQK